MRFHRPDGRNFPLFLSGVVLIGLLAGCATASGVSADELYRPPPPDQPAATIRGSSLEEGGMFGSIHRGFVSMVDLKVVADASARWSEPLRLTPGLRTIAAEYRYSNFMARAYLPFEAKPGASYQLMIKNSRVEAGDVRLYSDFWIIDATTGAPVTRVYHQQATGGKNGTIFYQTK